MVVQIRARVCELCGDEAALYCGSDAAFLCWKCDARVHGANFLVARHVRQPICGGCKGMVSGEYVAGVGGLGDHGCWLPLCNSCSADSGCDDSDVISSSPSSCVSSTNCVVQRRRTRRVKTRKSDLVRWCGKIIGVGGDHDVIVGMASRIFAAVCGSGSGRPLDLTRRVWLAASFWLSMRLRKTASLEKMRRLQEVSGVAEKLILAGQARIVRMLKDPRISRRGGEDVDREEGWAESC